MSTSVTRKLFACGPLLVFLAGAYAPLFAQNDTGALSGVIKDQSGAIVPNAKVSVTNESSGVARTTVSNSEGLFTVPGMEGGTYTVRVESSGFSTTTVTRINLLSGESVSLGTIELHLGTAQQEVTIQALAASVQTVDSQRDEHITGQELNQIALRGRDIFDTFRLLPGVSDQGGNRDAPAPANYGNIYINGARSTQRAVWFDGVSLNNSGSYSVAQLDPSMEAVAEMQVVNSTQLAEYGRNGTSTLTMISRGGGQDFHGVAAWYFRNTDLNANNFFSNRAGEARADYRYT